MEALQNYKIYTCSRWFYKRSFIFIWKRLSFGWKGIGFGALQYTILFASCLTLVFSLLESKSVMN